MMLPVTEGAMPDTEVTLDVSEATTLRAELRISENPENHTPELTLRVLEIPLHAGANQKVRLAFQQEIDCTRFAFVCLIANASISAHLSDQRVSGVISLCQACNKAVAKSAVQSPPPGIGVDTFEFWTPKRRPLGKNLAIQIDPPLRAFAAANLINGISRPTRATNAWAADFAHEQPVVRLHWDTPQTIASIELDFDTDFDHPMESVLMGHPERDMPFCVREVRISAEEEPPASSGHTAVANRAATRLLAEIADNHQTRCVVKLDAPVTTSALEIQILTPSIHVPAALFAVRCFGPVI
jgi:hypothetical protein